jgi:hypothetical protein
LINTNNQIIQAIAVNQPICYCQWHRRVCH